MLSSVGHERRRVADWLLLVSFWMLLTVLTSINGQGVAERKREQVRLKEQELLLRTSKSNVAPDGTALENVCDIQQAILLAYCTCDSLLEEDAINARCTIFNISDQNDSIWHSFRSQAKLEELELNVNEDGHLTFVPSVALRNLPQLTSLQIKHASIDTLASHTFADAKKLVELGLNRNKIRSIRPSAFHGLSNVTRLELGNNFLNSLERGVFDGLESLRFLFLDNNNISLVEDSVFQNLRQLEELDLSSNNIAVLASETLIGLQHLRRLTLRNNQLAILGDDTFARVPNLRRLDISYNQLQVIRHQALSGLTKLSHLNLTHNQLAELHKASLDPIWTNLMNSSMTFTMDGNPFQCDCRLIWILRDLKMATMNSNGNLQANLNKLYCITREGVSKNLVTTLSVLDCQPTFQATVTRAAVTARPSRGSTAVTYVVEEEEDDSNNAVKKQTLLINDSSASLQLSSSAGVQPPGPASTSVNDTSGRSAQSSATKTGNAMIVYLITALLILITAGSAR